MSTPYDNLPVPDKHLKLEQDPKIYFFDRVEIGKVEVEYTLLPYTYLVRVVSSELPKIKTGDLYRFSCYRDMLEHFKDLQKGEDI